MKKAPIPPPILLETIRITDGSVRLLPLHLDRMRRSCMELFGSAPPDPEPSLNTLPAEFSQGTVKCRITYSTCIHSVEFRHYTPRRIQKLRTVIDDAAEYHIKHADRSRLDALGARKEDADEILIVRNGLLTDTTFSNIICICRDKLITPARPLLEGVMRRKLIENGTVVEADISPDMLTDGNKAGITGIMLINAMLPPGSTPVISLSDITVTPDCR